MPISTRQFDGERFENRPHGLASDRQELIAHELGHFAIRVLDGRAEHTELEADEVGLARVEALAKTAPTDPVFVMANGKPITVTLAAETFRAHLTVAGVTRDARPDLFPEGTESKRRRAVRVHDLRGLLVTAALAEGRSDTWVRERTRPRRPACSTPADGRSLTSASTVR